MVNNLQSQLPIYVFIVLIGVIMSSLYAVPPNVTLIADPAVLKIPIHDSHEELVDLTKQT